VTFNINSASKFTFIPRISYYTHTIHVYKFEVTCDKFSNYFVRIGCAQLECERCFYYKNYFSFQSIELNTDRNRQTQPSETVTSDDTVMVTEDTDHPAEAGGSEVSCN
jgi:hypothetical protein